ncbi:MULTISPECIES: hypothetical protein [Sphingomonas]|uniref:hypothetical protein n=1 Tax=Sphingomonas TaxID=13687 RepID=UPI000DEF5D6C|nr:MULTISPECIES: hypothetical protein [Sphingomonas]
MTRLVLAGAALLLAGCGQSADDSIEPVPQDTNASTHELMNAADQAAGNAQARMSAEAGNMTTDNLQGETK